MFHYSWWFFYPTPFKNICFFRQIGSWKAPTNRGWKPTSFTKPHNHSPWHDSIDPPRPGQKPEKSCRDFFCLNTFFHLWTLAPPKKNTHIFEALKIGVKFYVSPLKNEGCHRFPVLIGPSFSWWWKKKGCTFGHSTKTCVFQMQVLSPGKILVIFCNPWKHEN